MTKFDWDNEGPSPRAIAAFEAVQAEKEFPDTYSGQAWLAAFRIWKAVKDTPDVLNSVGPYDDVPGVDLHGLGLSGFMYGWAVNAVRQMLGKPAGGNPAILTLGKGNEPCPSVGPAEKHLHQVLGGGDE